MANVRVLFMSCALVAAIGAGVQASRLEIQVSGVDLIYDGTDIYDATNLLGGSGEPSQADPLTTMTFLLDDVVLGTLTSSIYIDVFIADVPYIPAGGVVTSAGNGDDFGVDLLIGDSGPDAWGLALNIDVFQVYYSGFEIAMATSGKAASLWEQDLPFGASFTEPIETIAVVLSSAKLSDVVEEEIAGVTYLTSFRSSGTGNISGDGVPEPTALVLLGLGGLFVLRRRSQ